MKITRMLFVLTGVMLASPAMAVKTSHRGAESAKVAATASTHACPAHKDRDGKLRCSCAAGQASMASEPVFTDAG